MKINAGDRVTITNRFGQERTGRAVMQGPAGWVLNMGGRYGTPAVATTENIVKVRKARGKGWAQIPASRGAWWQELGLEPSGEAH